jgi:hypothetical protein
MLARMNGHLPPVRSAALALLAALVVSGARADDDARRYVQFVEDLSGTCSARMAKLLLVKNAHPSRKLRVWLDRIHMGQGTGDRSRSELAPNGQPEPLGCSRSTDGPQEWRVVRAEFVD